MGCTGCRIRTRVTFAAVIEGETIAYEQLRTKWCKIIWKKFLFSAAENCGSAAALMASFPGSNSRTFRRIRYTRSGAWEFAVTDSMRLVAENVFSARDDADSFAPSKAPDHVWRRLAHDSQSMDVVDVLVRRVMPNRPGMRLKSGIKVYRRVQRGAHDSFRGPHPGLVEVHWDLVNREDLVQSALFSPDMAHVWERMAAIGGRACLGGEDCLCYFAAHAVKEYFRSPKWLADLAFMLGKTKRDDAESVRRVADEWGVRPSLGLIDEALIDITGACERICVESFALYPGRPAGGLVARMLRMGAWTLRPFSGLLPQFSGQMCASSVVWGGLASGKRESAETGAIRRRFGRWQSSPALRRRYFSRSSI